jgi:hypothetical protein
MGDGSTKYNRMVANIPRICPTLTLRVYSKKLYIEFGKLLPLNEVVSERSANGGVLPPIQKLMSTCRREKLKVC